MRKLLQRFRANDEGTVSVDWVVLSAGVVAIGAGAASIVLDGTPDISEMLATQLVAENSGHSAN